MRAFKRSSQGRPEWIAVTLLGILIGLGIRLITTEPVTADYLYVPIPPTEFHSQPIDASLQKLVVVTATRPGITQRGDMLRHMYAMSADSSIDSLWIVVEQALTPSSIIRHVLADYTGHLIVTTSPLEYPFNQFNSALDVLATRFSDYKDRAIYFSTESLAFDTALLRSLSKWNPQPQPAAVFSIAFVNNVLYEGPVSRDGVVVDWRHVEPIRSSLALRKRASVFKDVCLHVGGVAFSLDKVISTNTKFRLDSTECQAMSLFATRLGVDSFSSLHHLLSEENYVSVWYAQHDVSFPNEHKLSFTQRAMDLEY